MSSEASLFPVFLKLEGRAVVLVGGGAAARVKLSELIRAGARVTVVAPEVRPEISSSGVTVVHANSFRAISTTPGSSSPPPRPR